MIKSGKMESEILNDGKTLRIFHWKQKKIENFKFVEYFMEVFYWLKSQSNFR